MTESLLAGDQNQQITSYKDHLVGEGKKFKDDEALARGKYEADNMIEVLKRQQDELRADYLKLRNEAEQRARLEEIVARLEGNNSNQSNIQQNMNSNNPENNVQQPSFKPEEIESLVSKKLQEFETSRKEQQNFALAQTKLKETLGDNYQNVLKERIGDLGLTEDYVNDLARKAPNALIKLLAPAEQQESFQTPPRSNAKPEQFAPRGAEKRTWSYYQKLKTTDPKKYYNPQTNVEMLNDMMTLGDSFKDGDYARYGD